MLKAARLLGVSEEIFHSVHIDQKRERDDLTRLKKKISDIVKNNVQLRKEVQELYSTLDVQRRQYKKIMAASAAYVQKQEKKHKTLKRY